jgi:fumarate hydratase class II
LTKKVQFRTEKDSLGNVAVPTDRYWGAQTQRSLQNFPIGHERFQSIFIKSYGQVKKAAALSNLAFNLLTADQARLICQVCDEIIVGTLSDHFPLVVWQTGSGTHTNMNLNEVIANRCAELVGKPMGQKDPIHPNDHVNKSQSSNDTFPTAMYIAASSSLTSTLLPVLSLLKKTFECKANEFSEFLKTGRTHLMDAAPLTLGQEFSAFAAQIAFAETAVQQSLSGLYHIAAGGTAVGTGLNSPSGFAEEIARQLAAITGLPIVPADNKFMAIAAHEAIVLASSSLKLLATSLLKIANDIRLLASGPRCGIGEIMLPANEPGSSIMPGKVNPSQCEALTMVAARVIGNDVTIGLAGASGHFQLNAFKPVMIFTLLESISLLTDGCESFRVRCLDGIKPVANKLSENFNRSLMLATALVPAIGYDQAAKIVRLAEADSISLKDAGIKLGILSAADFDSILKPHELVGAGTVK